MYQITFDLPEEAALAPNLLDVSKTKGEAVSEPEAMTNNLRGKTVTVSRICTHAVL